MVDFIFAENLFLKCLHFNHYNIVLFTNFCLYILKKQLSLNVENFRKKYKTSLFKFKNGMRKGLFSWSHVCEVVLLIHCLILLIHSWNSGR